MRKFSTALLATFLFFVSVNFSNAERLLISKGFAGYVLPGPPDEKTLRQMAGDLRFRESIVFPPGTILVTHDRLRDRIPIRRLSSSGTEVVLSEHGVWAVVEKDPVGVANGFVETDRAWPISVFQHRSSWDDTCGVLRGCTKYDPIFVLARKTVVRIDEIDGRKAPNGCRPIEISPPFMFQNVDETSDGDLTWKPDIVSGPNTSGNDFSRSNFQATLSKSRCIDGSSASTVKLAVNWNDLNEVILDHNLELSFRHIGAGKYREVRSYFHDRWRFPAQSFQSDCNRDVRYTNGESFTESTDWNFGLTVRGAEIGSALREAWKSSNQETITPIADIHSETNRLPIFSGRAIEEVSVYFGCVGTSTKVRTKSLRPSSVAYTLGRGGQRDWGEQLINRYSNWNRNCLGQPSNCKARPALADWKAKISCFDDYDRLLQEFEAIDYFSEQELSVILPKVSDVIDVFRFDYRSTCSIRLSR